MRLKPIPIIVLTIGLGACVSTHDLKRDGANLFGGGFIDEELGPGFFILKGYSNLSPFSTPNSAAKTFHLRAEGLCPNGYTEVAASTHAYQSSPSGEITIKKTTVHLPGNTVTSKSGYVLCSDSPISSKEAAAYVRRNIHE